LQLPSALQLPSWKP